MNKITRFFCETRNILFSYIAHSVRFWIQKFVNKSIYARHLCYLSIVTQSLKHFLTLKTWIPPLNLLIDFILSIHNL